MAKRKWFGLIALLAIIAFVITFGGCGGGGSSSGSSATTPSLTVTALDIGKVVSFTKAFSGDPGSSMDGFRVKVDKVELTTDTGTTWVTVYSNGEYIESVGVGTNSIAGTLNGTMPPVGTYTGLKFTFSDFKIKVKIVSGATTYYTTAQTVGYNSMTPWTLSTSALSYDYITITSTGNSETTDFPTPLTVTANSNINLVTVMESNGIVTCDGTLPNNVTWAEEEPLVRAWLPGMPSKEIQFNLTVPPNLPTYPALSNTITFLLDGSGNLLGGFCHRPANKAINGGILKSGGLSNVSNNGNTATFDVSFWDGMGVGWFKITGSYDCGTTTSGTYSGLVVTGYSGVTTEYGATVNPTGSVTSK